VACVSHYQYNQGLQIAGKQVLKAGKYDGLKVSRSKDFDFAKNAKPSIGSTQLKKCC